MPIDRRSFISRTVSTSALALLGASPAFAKAALSGHQVMGAYRHQVGTFEVIALSDGAVDIPVAMFAAAEPAEAARLMEANSLPKDKAPTAVNAFLVNTGDKLVLIDSGAGKLFGPTLGRFAANLAAFGIDPAAVDVIAMTHLHPDHFGGLLNADAKIAFPNAQFLCSEADMAFWRDEAIAAKVPADNKPFFDQARAVTNPFVEAKKYSPIADGKEVVPGITAIAAPGHTPGHTMYRVTSGSDTLLIWGDIIHNFALQFAHPDWSIAFDTDAAAGTVTRKRVFDMAASDKLTIAGAHIPFPGIGHVVKAGAAHAFVPAFWQPG